MAGTQCCCSVRTQGQIRPAFSRRVLFGVCVVMAAVMGRTLQLSAGEKAVNRSSPCLVVFFDGLRPDYITEEAMPNLYRFGQRGVVGTKHHSVFPTVTRVNATSLATGAYPAGHGILYNTIFLPDVLPGTDINTGEAKTLLQVEDRTNGRLLTTKSLGEIMEEAGKRLFVTSSGSTGASYLLNHKVSGDGIWNGHGFIRPISQESAAIEAIGPIQGKTSERTHWAVDACLHSLLSDSPPEVCILWLTDADSAGHRYGVGAAETLAAVKSVDSEFGRLLAQLEMHDRLHGRNIFVATDHGFSNHTGEFKVAGLLAGNQLQSKTRVVGGRQIYVENHDEETIRRIVSLLQDTPWAGAIFTRAVKPSSNEGFVAGTFSFDSIFWNHPRAPDILVDPNWSDEQIAPGYRGKTTNGGTAGHGSSSPFDIGIHLIAAGPDIRQGVVSSVPSGNIDIAPTLCHLLGIDHPASMHGRVLMELLNNGQLARDVAVQEHTHRVSADQKKFRYELELTTSRVGQTVYIDRTQVKRTELN